MNLSCPINLAFNFKTDQSRLEKNPSSETGWEGQWEEHYVRSIKELRSCHVAMVAKFLHIKTVILQIWQKKTKKLTCMTFLCMIARRNKTVAHTFLPDRSFENANGRLCQDGLLRSRNFNTMVT